MKKNLSLEIVSFKLNKRGIFDGKEDFNTLSVSAVAPTTGVPNVATTKMMKSTEKLPKKKAYTEDFEKRIVFKQEFNGPSLIKVNATAVDALSDLEEFAATVLVGIARGFLTLWTGGFSNAFVGQVVSVVGGAILDSASHDDSEAPSIGSGTIMLDPANLPEDGILTIELKVKKDVVERKIERRGGPRNRRVIRSNTVVLAEDENNGKLVIKVRELG